MADARNDWLTYVDCGPPVALPDGTVTFEVHDDSSGVLFRDSIHCPLPSGRHPQALELRQAHRAWVRNHDLLADDADDERFCAARFDLLVSAECHRISLEAALVVSQLMSWFFVFDDGQERRHAADPAGTESSRRATRRHLDVLAGDTPRSSDSKLLFAFADFLNNARALGDGEIDPWYRRLQVHLKDYIVATHGEGILTVPAAHNSALHSQIRMPGSGILPGCDIAASAQRLPHDVIARDVFVQRLDALCVNCLIWINDLFGLARDARYGGANTILVLRNEHALSLKEATRVVAHRFNQEMRAFLEIERALPRLAGKDWPTVAASATEYCEILKNCIRGFLDWSVVSDRYLRRADMAIGV
jgi:hypothetical protein